jgi:integrase
MLSTGETDYDRALLKAKEIVERAANPRVVKTGITFSQLVKEFTEHVEERWSSSTVLKDESRLHKLLAAFGNKKLEEITQQSIDQYMRKRKQDVVLRVKDGERHEQKIKASTVNRELTLLKLIFKQAISWKYLEVNPASEVKPFPTSYDYDDRRVLTEDELYRLFEACKKSDNPILYEIVKIAALTGMRKGELQNLTWDDVDFERNIIRVEQTKTRHTFYKPMTEELRKVLLSLRDKVPHSHYVFSQPDGTACGDWRRSFKTACKKAGLKDVCFHTLRHTCFSYLGMKGYSALEIQAYSGHKSLSMVQRYTHIPPSHVRSLADAIGATVVQLEKTS